MSAAWSELSTGEPRERNECGMWHAWERKEKNTCRILVEKLEGK
jgi:hypothetical protein